jgi:hypothetical protein
LGDWSHSLCHIVLPNCVAGRGRGADDMACSAWWLHDRDSPTQGLGQDWFTHMKTLAALLFLVQLCTGRWQFLLLAICVTETVHLQYQDWLHTCQYIQ